MSRPEAEAIQQKLNNTFVPWGIKVEAVEITFTYDPVALGSDLRQLFPLRVSGLNAYPIEGYFMLANEVRFEKQEKKKLPYAVLLLVFAD